jgi:hypothetical protein
MERNHTVIYSALALFLFTGCKSNKRETDVSGAMSQDSRNGSMDKPTVSAAKLVHQGTPPQPTLSRNPPEGLVVTEHMTVRSCNLEYINGSTVDNRPTILNSGISVKMTGWVLDQKGAALADAIAIRFSCEKAGDYYAVASGGLRRPDVPRALHMDSNLSTSGFQLTFESSLLPEGEYVANVIFRAHDKAYICEYGRKVARIP